VELTATAGLDRAVDHHGLGGQQVLAITAALDDAAQLEQLPEEAKASLSASVPFPPRLGEPSEYADLVVHIIANGMLNGEVIRLDGAIRMAPR
jgi:hypothetical protein